MNLRGGAVSLLLCPRGRGFDGSWHATVQTDL